jgi:hypothetical protein
VFVFWPSARYAWRAGLGEDDHVWTTGRGRGVIYYIPIRDMASVVNGLTGLVF